MPIHKLTAPKIAALIRKGRDGLFGDGGNLYLQIDGGSASWLLRFMRLGQRRHMGLGPLHTVNLAEARELALAARKVLLAGGDPLAARALTRVRSMTFDACVGKYLDAHRAGWKNPKHRQQWEITLRTHASPVFGALPVAAIDTGLVMKAIEPIWTKTPETAGRLRGRIESVLDWARVRGYRNGENPARWKAHLDHLLPARGKVRKVKHHAALPYTDVPAFMGGLRGQEGIAARALEFLILCAVRTGDLIGNDRDDAPPMRWQDVDFKTQVWTIPKTKSGASHAVPLSDAAVTLLRTIKQQKLDDDIVFASPDRRGKPLSNGAMLALLDRMNRGDVTVHGFRSSFRDWAGDQTAFARDVVETALAHAIESKTEAAYRRSDALEKRRRLMAAWADYCTSPSTSAKVVSIRS
jgi:integrase